MAKYQVEIERTCYINSQEIEADTQEEAEATALAQAEKEYGKDASYRVESVQEGAE